MEKERVTSVIFESCYDGLYELVFHQIAVFLSHQNTTCLFLNLVAVVCKFCKDDDGEDWPAYNSCCQFSHAVCLNVPFAETLPVRNWQC